MLSLRDLNDWVSKKEAELIGLSPIGGDESSLRKQQVTLRFKRCVGGGDSFEIVPKIIEKSIWGLKLEVTRSYS